MADLFHGPGDRLPADQLAADPDARQRRKHGAGRFHRRIVPVWRGAERGGSGLGHGPFQPAQGDRHLLFARRCVRLRRWTEPGQHHLAGDPGAGCRHVRERRAIGHALAGGALLSDPRPCHRRFLDARDRSLRRDSRRLERGYAAGVGVEFRAGADGTAGAGGIGRGGCRGERVGQPRGCDLRSGWLLQERINSRVTNGSIIAQKCDYRIEITPSVSLIWAHRSDASVRCSLTRLDLTRSLQWQQFSRFTRP
ncbi:hypothetical protein EMIT047CA2_20390 [Pseudomonas soli]